MLYTQPRVERKRQPFMLYGTNSGHKFRVWFRMGRCAFICEVAKRARACILLEGWGVKKHPKFFLGWFSLDQTKREPRSLHCIQCESDWR